MFIRFHWVLLWRAYRYHAAYKEDCMGVCLSGGLYPEISNP